jgi:hypothetical protein
VIGGAREPSMRAAVDLAGCADSRKIDLTMMGVHEGSIPQCLRSARVEKEKVTHRRDRSVQVYDVDVTCAFGNLSPMPREGTEPVFTDGVTRNLVRRDDVYFMAARA